MSKGMSVKDALKQFEEESGQKAKEAKIIKLVCRIPFIEKMDASLSQLEACEQLSLSTNKIEKIANLSGLKNLKILSIGRNALKTLSGIETAGDTLEELWCSYNNIDKTKGLQALKKLKVLHMAHNKVADMGEVAKLSGMPALEDLLFIGNPIEESMSEAGTWVTGVKNKLTKIKKLDGVVLVDAD